jgi:hypothetical protein
MRASIIPIVRPNSISFFLVLAGHVLPRGRTRPWRSAGFPPAPPVFRRQNAGKNFGLSREEDRRLAKFGRSMNDILINNESKLIDHL